MNAQPNQREHAIMAGPRTKTAPAVKANPPVESATVAVVPPVDPNGAKRKRNTLPVIDVTALVIEDAEDMPKQTRNRVYKVNPFTDALTDSYNEEVPKSVVVPDDHVKAVEALLRHAATELGIGVRIVRESTDTEGYSAVTFLGRERKVRKPRESK